MEEKNRNEIHNHYESGANCQVFNGDVTNCVFAMPGSTVTQQAAPPQTSPNADRLTHTSVCPADDKARDEELLHFIHPSVDSTQEWQVHDEVKRLVARQGIQEICQYLLQMRKDNKVLLPQ